MGLLAFLLLIPFFIYFLYDSNKSLQKALKVEYVYVLSICPLSPNREGVPFLGRITYYGEDGDTFLVRSMVTMNEYMVFSNQLQRLK